MRVAIFCETYLPYLNGVVTHVKLLKQGLEKHGHQVLIVTADPTVSHHKLEGDVLYCPALRLKQIYNYGLANPYSQKRVKILEDFNPDVCHIHQEFSIGLFALQYAKKHKKPVVYTLHTIYDEYLYYVAPKPLINTSRKLFDSYTKYFAVNSDVLTGPSIKVEKIFRGLGVKNPIHIIPNPVALGDFSADFISQEENLLFREKMGIDSSALLCIFVGRLGREKSVDVLLDYFAQELKKDDNIYLLVIGDGPAKKELEEQAKKLDLSEKIIFTGKIIHEELLPYYTASDVYLTASLSDTYSISMLEGMAVGLPIIQRYDELNKDQVREGENGFVFDNPQELVSALKKVQNMPKEQLLELKKNVLEGVKERSAGNFALKLIDVYEEAINTFNPYKGRSILRLVARVK